MLAGPFKERNEIPIKEVVLPDIQFCWTGETRSLACRGRRILRETFPDWFEFDLAILLTVWKII